MRRLPAAGLLVLLVLLALLAGCAAEDAAAPQPSVGPSVGPPVGEVETVLQPCPEQPDEPATGRRTLPALALDCLGGGTLDLGRAPGAPTVVNLWASWCGPCREELPVLQRFADRAAGRVRVVGVISQDGVPQAGSFAADAGVTFPGAFDGEGRLMAELGVNALPRTFLLDAGGALVHTEIRPVDSVEDVEALVAEHLGVRL